MAGERRGKVGRSRGRALPVTALLIVVFAAVSLAAEWRKSITVDELVYTVAGYIDLHTGDGRLNPEHPALWKLWASLSTLNFPLRVDYSSRDWQQLPQNFVDDWAFAVKVAFRTPGNDAERLIWRCRPMMILAGVMLVVLVGRWARQLGGGTAAMVATALICLDPNFLAHSSLVTNDVPVAGAMLLATYAAWRLGERMTLWRVLLLGLACGLCLNTKLSGLLIVALVVVLLILRSLSSTPWIIWNKSVHRRDVKLSAAVVAIVCAAVISYGIIWASYGFRYAAVADSSQRLDVVRVLGTLAESQLQAKHPGRVATPQELAAWRPSPVLNVVLSMMDHQVLPEGWLFGLLFSVQNTQSHSSFLLGRLSDNGWWYYFPLVVLFKTPLTTLGALAGAATVVMHQGIFRRTEFRGFWRGYGWTAACLGLPLVTYSAVAMLTPLDIGIRYILPIYPWVYIATSVVAAYAWRRRPRIAIPIGVVLAVALATETALAFPNYLAFFNVASGGSRGGLRLLGDSNLDWGQDLFALRAWQQKHPSADLYLCYFGSADPAAYGIRYTPLPGGYPFERRTRSWPTVPCTVAISATRLQGIYVSDALRAQYAKLLRGKPIDCLGGSIYLFEVKPAKTALD